MHVSLSNTVGLSNTNTGIFL